MLLATRLHFPNIKHSPRLVRDVHLTYLRSMGTREHGVSIMACTQHPLPRFASRDIRFDQMRSSAFKLLLRRHDSCTVHRVSHACDIQKRVHIACPRRGLCTTKSNHENRCYNPRDIDIVFPRRGLRKT
jgi:hypothetical protein